MSLKICPLSAAIAIALLASCSQGPVKTEEAATDDPTSARKAKEAIVELIRTKQAKFIGLSDAEKLAREPIHEDGEGKYRVGPFLIKLRELTYEAYFGIESDEPYIYKGTFVVEDSHWRAAPPQLIRQHRDREKPAVPDRPGKSKHAQGPSSANQLR